MPDIIVNGIQTEYISALDRGLHYGDGIFETIACVDNRLQFWEQHMERMAKAAEKLDIAFPGAQLFMDDIVKALAIKTSGENCVVKLLLTRGSAERGYRSPARPLPCRIVVISAWPKDNARIAENGARLTMCRTQLSVNPQLAGIKHLNRLENVLARNEWRDQFDEGLMTDQQNNIIEATMSNVFSVRAGELFTPPVDHCGINGIIRQQLLDIADELNITLRETTLSQTELMQMDEIMLTNCVIGLWPVTEFAGRTFPKGQLSALLSRTLSKRAAKYAQALA